MISWQRRRLLLASHSASRQAMLNAAGIAFDCEGADVDERAITAELAEQGKDARAIALALATAKAQAVSARWPDRWVLGGDSIVSIDGRMFAKPVDRADAADHLNCFSGQLMTLDSAAVLARGGQLHEHACDDAHLEVRHLSDGFIDAYLDAEWPAIAGCVGCFRIEGLGVHLFERLTGSQFTILGMPLLPVLDMLRRAGIVAP